MRIVRFRHGQSIRWGELRGAVAEVPDAIVRVAPIEGASDDTAQLIDAFGSGKLVIGHELQVSASSLLSPITHAGVILCQALNYRDHAAEAKQTNRKSNLIFTKAGSSLTGPFDPIVRPSVVELLDYEVEIGLVLRKGIERPTAITDANIGEFVAGVVLADEVSARDIQFGDTFLQWFRGKSFRTFCPIGSVLWLIRPDEVRSALENIEITLDVNGERRQTARSADLIYKPAETLAYISQWLNVAAGTLLLTGTPGGVTAASSAEVVAAMKEHLYDDETRVRLIREAGHKNYRPFLGPGDVVSARMTDLRDQSMLSAYRNVVEIEK